MRKVGFIFGIVLLGIMTAVPVFAAVPCNGQNGISWPIATQPTVPSPSQDSRPVQAPTPDKTGTGNADKISPVRNLTADESYILEQVNAERAKAGLAPLQVDYRLAQNARTKSQDMITQGYFDHQSPSLGSPFDQMNRAGITYQYAGENIAANSTAAGAMESWMNSPGHRANILNPNFTHIGIGVVDGGQYGKMLTQQFIG